jgi:predicted acylesterase/phospholipase RssA
MAGGARRIHLLLGAGGVRCLSYIGALEQLEREGYEIATVSTCSAGTFVGALYCCGVSPPAMREAALDLDLRRLAGARGGPSILRAWGLVSWPYALYREPGSPSVFREVLGGQGLDPDPTLEDLRPPLSTAAVDVAGKRLLVYSSEATPKMRVAELLSIATAVPIFYPPHLRQGREVLDASLASQVPIWLATGQSEDLPIVVLRVREANRPIRRSLLSWLNQVLSGSISSRDTLLLERLPNVRVYEIPSELSWSDFALSRSQVEELIEGGQRAVAEKEERQQEENAPLSGVREDDRAQGNAGSLYQTHLERVARSRTATIFLSYAREDRQWVEQLRHRLGDLLADRNVSVWDDSYIKPGGIWDAALEDAIRRARVAVLFVSRNFVESKYIADTELPLLRKHVAEGCVLWVSIDGAQPSGAEAGIQAVGEAKALSAMSESDADRVLSELAHLVEETYRTAGEGAE